MATFGTLLPPPPAQRRAIPLYHAKTAREFREDVYERYDELVTRQTALHLADDLHGGYPFAPIREYLQRWLPAGPKPLAVADVGCSVGRLAAGLARDNPAWDVYGIDFSYQMLRQAHDYWLTGQTLRPNLARYGWGTPTLTGHRFPNIRFALARAAALPFPPASLDLLFSTFLVDRVPDPVAAFAEWNRVLRTGGRLLFVSPLNYLQPARWRDAFPPVKLLHHLTAAGWELLDWTDPLPVFEPMDARGNGMNWRCVAGVFEKTR